MGIKSIISNSGIIGLFKGSCIKSLDLIVPLPPLPPTNAYVAENGTTYYVAENGTTYYVQESSPGLSGQSMGLLAALTYAT